MNQSLIMRSLFISGITTALFLFTNNIAFSASRSVSTTTSTSNNSIINSSGDSYTLQATISCTNKNTAVKTCFGKFCTTKTCAANEVCVSGRVPSCKINQAPPTSYSPDCLTKQQCIDNDNSLFNVGKLGVDDVSAKIASSVTTPSGTVQDTCKSSAILYEQVCVQQVVNGKSCYISNKVPYFCSTNAQVCSGGACVTDLCPELPGIQLTYPVTTRGAPNSCIPPRNDLCPDIEGVQKTYLYDLDGDGEPESCSFKEEEIDKCPNIPNVQPFFLYDTNGDGIKDSCEPVVDLCPNTPKVDVVYPYDNNNDGIFDSCNELVVDLCPETPEIDNGYLFDTNSDGVNDSCIEVAENFCTDSNAKNNYPEGLFSLKGNNNSISLCIDGDIYKRHEITCQSDGSIVSENVDCPSFLPCQNGACVKCIDEDGPGNFEVIATTYANLSSSLPITSVQNDICGSTSNAIVDYSCDASGKITSQSKFCDPGMSPTQSLNANGQAICTCQPDKFNQTCTDEDGYGNYDLLSKVTTVDSNSGKSKVYNDFCSLEYNIGKQYDYFCENKDLNNNKVNLQVKSCSSVLTKSIGADGKEICACKLDEHFDSCKDSDGKDNFEVIGTVTTFDEATLKTTVYKDSCITGKDNKITEYYCGPRFEALYKTKICPEGMITQNSTNAAGAKTCICVNP